MTSRIRLMAVMGVLAVGALLASAPPAKAQITSGQARGAIDFAETWGNQLDGDYNNLRDNIEFQQSRAAFYATLFEYYSNQFTFTDFAFYVQSYDIQQEELTQAGAYADAADDKREDGWFYFMLAEYCFYDTWPKDYQGAYDNARLAAQDNYPIAATGYFPDGVNYVLWAWPHLTNASANLDGMEAILRKYVIPWQNP